MNRFPPVTLSLHSRIAIIFFVITLCLSPAHSTEAAGAIDGYLDDQAIAQQVGVLSRRDSLTATELAYSPGNRPVWLLTIAQDHHAAKPAILIVGAADAPRLVGTEIVMRLADLLSDPDNESAASLRSRFAFYLMPRPNPDASAAFFRTPYNQRTGNDRATDDDRDHTTNEDGPDDLNGDGHITMMRVEDPNSRYIPHPDNNAILIEADPLKSETGRYAVYTEGRDDDGDEQFNEDGPGGVNLNVNLTFDYPYFEPGAGPHQVSEPESRALLDFAYDHPEIALVFTTGADDNLYHPWNAEPSGRQGRIKTQLIQDDQPYTNRLAELFREAQVNPDDPPTPGSGAGSFPKWAYFHFGRWSLSTPGWWIPKVPQPDSAPDPQTLDEVVGGPLASESSEPPLAVEPIVRRSTPEESRGSDELNALRYLATNQIDGFAPWVPIVHPDFPDNSVEIGSFKPFFLLNPPADQLDTLAAKHLDFLTTLTEQLPRIEITEAETESLGPNVTRLNISVTNHGFLPTITHMGRINQTPYPMRFELTLPDDAELIIGHRRGTLPPIEGSGGTVEHTWLIRTAAPSIHLKVGSPATGWDETEIEL